MAAKRGPRLLALLLLLPALLSPGLAAAANEEPRGVGASLAGADADRVTELPKFDGDLEGIYSGYLTVDPEAGRDLFYMLAEHEGNTTDRIPLLMWTQGGPGCSPVGIGAFQELGPFAFKHQGVNVSDLQLEKNPYSWTLAASMLFIDSPAFTGFSTSKQNVTDRYWADANTTADNLDALLLFYDRFPEYRTRPLYLAGESYSGHYIPLLAQAILEYNAALLDGAAPIPLEGYAVGNAWTHPALDNKGAVDFWYALGMLSRDTYDGLLDFCNFTETVLWRTEGESGVTGECAEMREAAQIETSGYYIYGLNAPGCVPGPDGEPLEQQPTPPSTPSPLFDPCAWARVGAWFQRQDVQEALHAIQPGEEARPWKECDARAITYSVDSLLTSMVPVHEQLVEAGLRALVYSGDSDGIVPTLSSRSWVETLGLPTAGELRPWVDTATGQVGGYVQPYEGLTFATLHGAGHVAPAFKPSAALELVRSWLTDTPLPEQDS